RPPLGADHFLNRGNSRAPRRVEQIAIGPMLQRVSPRVTPIVEDLAPKQMASNAPFMSATFLFQPIMSAHQVVKIRYFKSGMIESGLAGSQQKHCVMVARDRAAIASQESAECLLRRARVDLI